MDNIEIWRFVLQGGIGVGVTLVGIGVAGIYRQLRQLNGAVIKLSQWSEGHDKIDDERHEGTRQNLTEIWSALDKLREGQ